MKKLLILVFMMFWGVAYADTETVKWYVDGNVYDTTTCQTGGNVNLPTSPTKRGYAFAGWMVALYDFSTLDYATNGNSSINSGKTWTAGFSYGWVTGTSLCSVSGSDTTAPDETTPGGTFCWCKATGFQPSGSNVIYEPTSSLPWVYSTSWGSASQCNGACASISSGGCANVVRINSSFRKKMFGIQ